MNYWDYLSFSKRIVVKKGLPVQLVFFVTSRCDLRCSHCFYRNSNYYANNELTLDEIKLIFHGFSFLWISLTGGEPFLRNDLDEIANAICSQNRVFNLSIPTNGQKTERIVDCTKKILEKCQNTYVSVSLSLDGMESIHDSIRGEGAFKKAITTLEELKKLKKYPNFGISVQSTLTPKNGDSLQELYQFVSRKLKPDAMTINLLRDNGKENKIKYIDLKNYLKITQAIFHDFKKRKFAYYKFPLSNVALARNFATYKKLAELYEKRKYLTPCFAGILSGVMNEVGDIFACEDFRLKMGNIREQAYDLRKIWYSKEAEVVRNRIKDSKCFCTYECAMSINTLFDPRHFPNLAYNYISLLLSKWKGILSLWF